MRRRRWITRWIGPVRTRAAEGQGRPSSLRDHVAVLVALATVGGLGAAFVFSKGTAFLMPGPLTSSHGAIEKCSTCHSKSGGGKLSWVHGLLAGDPKADSKACLTCHKMPDTAFNPHGASASVLKQSTERLMKVAAQTVEPQSAQAQSKAFPTHGMVVQGVECATCHQEHQGTNFKLNRITNEQCRSCHVVKFDSFDGDHPKFENYPFTRRTRITYDHAGHFNKHYPELAKKDPAKRIPADCATCHNANGDKRIMAVAPFEQTCSGCHLDQITGKARVSGPKGIAFLTLPGIDLETLNKKRAAIGEWPDASDAALTPFMKVMISRNEQGRALVKAVDGLDLQDLSKANDVQIKAVTDLVWDIKRLFHALIAGKASDGLGDLTIGGGAKLSATLVADLTANIPRDVVVSAQQQWLPNLAKEIALGQDHLDHSGSSIATTEQNAATLSPPRDTANAKKESEASEEKAPSGPDAPEAAPSASPKAARGETASNLKRDSQACLVRVFGQCLVSKVQENKAETAQSAGSSGLTEAPSADPEDGKETPFAGEPPPAMRAGLQDVARLAAADGASEKNDAAPEGKTAVPSPDKPAQGKAAEQSDDLLHPTPEELREIKAHTKGDGKAVQPDAAAGKSDTAPKANSDAALAKPQTQGQPVAGVESDVDPESWAEYGGWYRQDCGIFYRPAGHKDKFINAWLLLTGPQAPKGATTPAAAVFDFLTSKDAQGACTKCHSVDEIPGKGRLVNFSQASIEGKQGRFTTFIHEPHFGIMDNRGCLTCHSLEKNRPYLKSYEQGNPQSFASNFAAVKKELCQTCHTSSKARQDCLTCHKYHVNGVITPAMATKVPMQ